MVMWSKMIELIDTHCHLTFDPLAENIEAVVARSIQAGITVWVTVGTNITENRNAIELASKYENVYAANNHLPGLLRPDRKIKDAQVTAI